MAEIQKIVTLLVGWINVQVVHHHSILKGLSQKSYHLHSGMPLFKNSVNMSYLKEIKLFLHSLVRGLERTQSK